MDEVFDNEYFESKLEMVHLAARRFCINHEINSDTERDDFYQMAYIKLYEMLCKRSKLPDKPEDEIDAYICRSVLNHLKIALWERGVYHSHEFRYTYAEHYSLAAYDEEELFADMGLYTEGLSEYANECVEQVIRSIPKEKRDIVRRGLPYMIQKAMGRTYNSIAEQEKTPANTIVKRAGRARDVLKNIPGMEQQLRALLA